MSETVTQTKTSSRDHGSVSRESIHIRPRSPQPPSSSSVSLSKPVKQNSIELAEISPKDSSVETPNLKTDPTESGPSLTNKQQKWTALIQFATLCWTLFLVGWNDGTTGPLLPRMQSNYHVGYVVVSLIFIFNCVGYVTGAGANVYLTDKFGFGKTMVIGSLAQLVGYSLQAPAPPFPVFILGYVFNGFGLALQDAGANGYVASLKDNADVKMGILHSVYGLGAFAAPLSATQFAKIERWSFQYLVSLGIAVSNTILLLAIFKFKRQEQCLEEIGQARTETATANHVDNKYRQIFRLREVHILAIFILIYVGVEVSIGGWSVEYVIKVRGGGGSSGYVSSGFFGGLAFGRIVLLPVNKWIGERRAMFIYTALAIALEFIVWFVPSLAAGAVAVALIGMLLGPVYPIVMNHSARILPHWLLTGCIGWIAGFGQTGVAFIPFVTGVIASKAGISALQPIMIAMMSVMFVLWMFVPNTLRRME